MMAIIEGRDFKRILSMAKKFSSKHGRLYLSVSTSCGWNGERGHGIAYLTTDEGYKQIFFNAAEMQCEIVCQSIAVTRIAYINYPAIEKAIIGGGKISIYCQGGEIYTHPMREE